jgi:hypothetical protein
MLNKKDPLIGAVQQVMQRNQVEREAAQAVNEYFGVTDRKALPHERQGEWNAAYQQVLNEGLSPAQQKHMDVDDDEDIDHNDLAMIRARKKKKKLEEADEGKPGLMFKKIAAKAAKRYGSEEAGNRVAGAIRAKMAKAGKLEEASLEDIQEEIAYNLAEQAEYVYENYGEEGLVEFFDSLTEEQLELLEGWGDQPGSPLDRIKKYFGFGGSPTPPSNTNPGISRLNSGQGAGARQPETKKTNTVDPTKQTSGPNRGLPNQSAIASTGEKANPSTQTSGPNRGLDQSAPKTAAPAPAPIPKARPDNLKTNTQSAPKAKAAQPAKAAPKKKLSFFQKQTLRSSAKNDTMDQTRRLEKRYGVKPGSTRSMEEQSVLPKNLGPGSGFAGQHSVGNKTVRSKSPEEFMKQTSTYQGMSDAIRKPFDTTVKPGAPKSDIKTPIMDRAVADKAAKDAASRKALGNAVMSGRVGDPGKQNFIQNARANKERVKAAGGDGSQFLPKASNDPKLAQAMKDRAKEVNDNERAGGKPLISQPVDMRGGGSDYRAAQTPARQKAAPINVSDTEVMNSPEFKKARQSVGGESGARKIAPGTRIQGLGSFNKDDTIMSRTRKYLAAKKNVGRES